MRSGLTFTMYIVYFTLFLISGPVVNSVDIQTDEGVLVLNKVTFESAAEENQYILVEFYAPWCEHCKALAPEYAKAAKKLEESGSPIKLGKVDATEAGELAERFGVRGYPTLKFFKNNSPLDYSGGRTADEIVNWLLKKTGPPAKTLSTVEEAQQTYISEHKVAVIGFFKDQESEAAKNYLAAAGVIDDQVFGITSDDSVFQDNKVDSNKIVLFKKFDEGRAELSEDITQASIKKFVTTESLPLVVEFNHETAQKIFGGEIKYYVSLNVKFH